MLAHLCQPSPPFPSIFHSSPPSPPPPKCSSEAKSYSQQIISGFFIPQGICVIHQMMFGLHQYHSIMLVLQQTFPVIIPKAFYFRQVDYHRAAIPAVLSPHRQKMNAFNDDHYRPHPPAAHFAAPKRLIPRTFDPPPPPSRRTPWRSEYVVRLWPCAAGNKNCQT